MDSNKTVELVCRSVIGACSYLSYSFETWTQTLSRESSNATTAISDTNVVDDDASNSNEGSSGNGGGGGQKQAAAAASNGKGAKNGFHFK